MMYGRVEWTIIKPEQVKIEALVTRIGFGEECQGYHGQLKDKYRSNGRGGANTVIGQ